MRFEKGDLVEFDGLLAVVVKIGGESGVPDEHLALWFGEENPKRASEGGGKNEAPQLWTVPAEYCLPAKDPEIKH